MSSWKFKARFLNSLKLVRLCSRIVIWLRRCKLNFFFDSSLDSSLVIRRWSSWKFFVLDSIRFSAEMSESGNSLELREGMGLV